MDQAGGRAMGKMPMWSMLWGAAIAMAILVIVVVWKFR